jgi:hypothetical protein
MTTFSDNSTVDHQIENVYKQAASLFDPGTRLDLSNEYDRGVTELATRLLGMDSDDKDDVAETISFYTNPNYEHLLRRKRVNSVIDRIWPEGTLDEFYSETTEVAVVEDKAGNLWRVWPDGDVQRYRS